MPELFPLRACKWILTYCGNGKKYKSWCNNAQIHCHASDTIVLYSLSQSHLVSKLQELHLEKLQLNTFANLVECYATLH